MGNKVKTKRTSARRAATFLAALGVLVMSSGVALMVTATPANARGEIHKSYVCKYITTPGGDELVQTGQNPIWVDNHAIAGKDLVSVGDTFTDGQQKSVVIIANTAKLKPEPSISRCTSGGEEQQPGDASASAVPVQPTCTTAASYTTSVSHATFTSLPAAVAGTTIHLTAEADDGFAFDNGDTTLDVPLTFDAAPTNCGQVVSPPQVCTAHCGGGGHTHVSPPKAKAEAAAVTPTVVHAGLTSVSTDDVRGEQGLALMLAGMVMLFGAGGLRLRAGARASRI
jgi:hypothetical protein